MRWQAGRQGVGWGDARHEVSIALHCSVLFPRHLQQHQSPDTSWLPPALQADLERVQRAGNGRVDITVGSALDIFGGQLPYADVVAWHRQQQAAQPQQAAAQPTVAAKPQRAASAEGPAADTAAADSPKQQPRKRAESSSSGPKQRGEPQPDGTILYRDIASMN